MREQVFTLATEQERERLAANLRAAGRTGVRLFETVLGSKGQFTLLQLGVSERPHPVIQHFEEGD